MHDFILRELTTEDILTELNAIGFDKAYASRACEKFYYKNIKIFGLSVAQANILKQTALSVGADCATNKNTITGNIDKTDCILGGSLSQIAKIAVKLGLQPFGLRKLGREIENFLAIESGDGTQIMGILNLTPDSFSDGGMYEDFEQAAMHLIRLVEDGADMVDIGAESTKPYSEAVSAGAQLEKIIPILDFVRENNIDIPISIDTRSAEVAKYCLEAGATAINDVSGLLFDENMAEVVADFECPVIIQHSKGIPETMQINPMYTNLMDEIFLDLSRRIELATSKGINKDNIIIDPGIGFGKTREHNFEIIKRIGELRALDCPILLGVSRKSLLNMADEDNDIKDIYTVALNTLAVERKVDIIRVHNVKLHRKLLDMLDNQL